MVNHWVQCKYKLTCPDLQTRVTGARIVLGAKFEIVRNYYTNSPTRGSRNPNTSETNEKARKASRVLQVLCLLQFKY